MYLNAHTNGFITELTGLAELALKAPGFSTYIIKTGLCIDSRNASSADSCISD